MAMSIAVVKAVLVAAFFMHLLYDKKVNSIVMTSTIFAVSLFIGLTLMDLDVRGMTPSDDKSEIFPGGNVSLYNKMGGAPTAPQDASTFVGNVIEYAAESHAQTAGNPEGEGAAPGAPEPAPDAGATPDEEPPPPSPSSPPQTDGH
jgi:cytochrome c oxidase subunit 4